MEQDNGIMIAPAKQTPVMVRREMAKMPAVMDALGTVEKAVFLASTAKTISEYNAGELAGELNNALRWIAKDIGYRITAEGDMQYLVIRTAEILKRYYSTFTLKDFQMAFEMAITGELDEFLPRGRDGQPDRNHYQQFNAEYICKILNAYKARRGWILRKAHDAMPEPEKPRDLRLERYYRNQTRRACIDAFIEFKYRGYMPALTPIGEMLCYKTLAAVGLADEIEITLADQNEIWERTVNQYAGRFQRRREPDSERGSFVVARRKALERTFARMVKHEIQITDYIKFE